MGDEIELELAWLIKYLPDDLKKCRSIKIVQAYIDHKDPKIKDIRIREKGGVFTYTVKRFAKNSQETGYCREETKQISQGEFLQLMENSNQKISKMRYFYLLPQGLTAEVDVYKDNLKGLDVVEVEFPSVKVCEKFEIPAWFGKEVTDSKGIYPPFIANLSIDEVHKINRCYEQKPHDFS